MSFMFDKILIANRGEIACRVIRTARRMGIRTVAVYSQADAGAQHVKQADEAYLIGPAPARESYLVGARIIEVALQAGAQAVHPGYGFLSENAGFADACAAAGLVFIGPPAAAIRAMGSKSAAKSLMETANVPLVPGYHGDEQKPEFLADQAERIGYPVLIKASAGGGGKGMRVVRAAADFIGELGMAQGEARASFGDDHVLVERYLTKPRHIEIQVFADGHGNVVHLFERDCSIQRRHQKVVEEAPAPGMTAARRQAMGEAACAAARAIGYQGAGTVEFIAEGDDFFFMEMNTRLQVEHPVTEMITGQDLVEWQLRVAAGAALPLRQQDLAINGHAIEVRVCAEDPARDFAPSVGRIGYLRTPEVSARVRIDTGVVEGDTIAVHYDPMIAKLIVWGADRDEAVRSLGTALAGYEIAGIDTNLGLLRAIMAHPAFREGGVDTGFIGRYADTLLRPAPAAPPAVIGAAIARLLRDGQSQMQAAFDPFSPWNTGNAWRANGKGYQDFSLDDGVSAQVWRVYPGEAGAFRLGPASGGDAGGVAVAVRAAFVSEDRLILTLEGAQHRFQLARAAGTITVFQDGQSFQLSHHDPLAPRQSAQAGNDRVVAPMPGRVLEIKISVGETVARGQVLLIIEAMKVQMRIISPKDGVVSAIRCAAGELVDDGVELVSFEVAAP